MLPANGLGRADSATLGSFQWNGSSSEPEQVIRRAWCRRSPGLCPLGGAVTAPMSRGRIGRTGCARSGTLFGRNVLYDFNVFTPRKRVGKLRYLHQNPVKRGLVAEAEKWPWTSYRSYAFGEKGRVRINEWGKSKLKIRVPAARIPTITKNEAVGQSPNNETTHIQVAFRLNGMRGFIQRIVRSRT